MSAQNNNIPTENSRHDYSKEVPALLPLHLAQLLKSAISSDVIQARGYRSVTSKQELARLGFSEYQQRIPCLLIPQYSVNGSISPWGYQIRPDQPRLSGTKSKPKPIKYESVSGQESHLDISPAVKHLIKDVNTPLWFTEGVKKEDSLASRGQCAVSLVGVYGFKGRDATGSSVLLADFDLIPLENRLCYLCFDSDWQTNSKVKQALNRLATHLRNKGAAVLFIRLPMNGKGKNGIDDYLAAGHSIEDVLKLACESLDTPEASTGDSKATILTDSTNAELVAELFGDRLRYDHRQDRWLCWVNHHWQPDADAAIFRVAIEAARERYRRATVIQDLKERERVASWAIQSENRSRIEACISIAKAIRPIADTGENWDSDIWLLGVGNGVVDLHTGELRAGRREDRITMATKINYDHNAKCPRWMQFLDEIFQNDKGPDDKLLDWIWRALGHSISGDISEQICLIGYGTGANGKGKFTDAIRNTLGDYAYDAPFSTFELYNRASIPNDLAALEHRRFVCSSETNDGTRLNESRVKALSHGDPVTARYLHQEYFTFQPACKIWLFVNNKPVVRDDSYGFWRGVRLIPFTRVFKGEAEDKHLGDKLKAEAPGILAWLVRGFLECQKRGLSDIPESITTATEAYKSESDPLAQFISEQCKTSEDLAVKASRIYQVYRTYTEERKLIKTDILSLTTFGSRLSSQFQKKHYRDGWYYLGIAIKGDDSQGILSSNEGKPTIIDGKLENIDGKSPPNIKKSENVTGYLASCDGLEGQNDVVAIEKPRMEENIEEVVTPVTPVTKYTKILSLWEKLGKPLVHLGPGQNTEHLDMVLSRPDVKPEHLAVIRAWYEEKKGGSREC